MPAAFILMIITWTNSGAVYAMQEMASEEACKVARSFVFKQTMPKDSATIVKCINKQTGEGS